MANKCTRRTTTKITKLTHHLYKYCGFHTLPTNKDIIFIISGIGNINHYNHPKIEEE